MCNHNERLKICEFCDKSFCEACNVVRVIDEDFHICAVCFKQWEQDCKEAVERHERLKLENSGKSTQR